VVLEQVAAPSIILNGGPTFAFSTLFVVSCPTAGAEIHYTIDGTDPTAASPLYPSSGVTVTLDQGALAAREFSVKAIAIKSPSMGNSAVVSAGPFWLLPKVASPIITPASSGPFLDKVLVSMACSTPASEIRYTTDGSSPLSSPTALVYTSPIELKSRYPATNEISAVATRAGFTPSGLVEASWTVEAQASPPAIELPGGTYIVGVPVTIACADTSSACSIRYTIDGSSPEVAAALTYTGPFSLAKPGTYIVRAVVVEDHHFNSPVVASAKIEVRADPTCHPNYYDEIERR
jgi:chitinase